MLAQLAMIYTDKSWF